MTLFEILSHDERFIVFSNEGERVIITWNRSLTFQYWQNADIGDTDCGIWNELDVITVSNEPKNFEEARKKAQAWFGQYLSQNEG